METFDILGCSRILPFFLRRNVPYHSLSRVSRLPYVCYSRSAHLNTMKGLQGRLREFRKPSSPLHIHELSQRKKYVYCAVNRSSPLRKKKSISRSHLIRNKNLSICQIRLGEPFLFQIKISVWADCKVVAIVDCVKYKGLWYILWYFSLFFILYK